MKFYFLCPREDHKVVSNADFLRKLGIKIVDLRFAPVLNSAGEIVDEVEILVCRASLTKIFKIEKEYDLGWTIYENKITLNYKVEGE